MSTIEIGEDAFALAAQHARAAGLNLDDWLATAIGRLAAQEDVDAAEDLPVDDCGFPVFTVAA